MINVAVIGAGVVGLASAVKIKEKYQNFNVVIISKEFSPNTTGDGSGGLWYPYLVGNTKEEDIITWGIETYNYLYELWRKGSHGICFMPMYSMFRESRVTPKPRWAHDVFGFRYIERRQIEFLRTLSSINYASGQTFLTFVVPTMKMTAYLQDRFVTAGGFIIPKEVTSLQDDVLEGFNVVVNCTGLGAKWMVPDEKVYAIRGQVARVEAPWIMQTFMDEESGNYIIPNDENCVMGGTHQENNYSTQVNDHDSAFIFQGCQTINPTLKHAKFKKHWVGLRPGRTEIRLCTETRGDQLFIHNYGHGGSGFTLFWGCASGVLNKLEDNLQQIKQNLKKSKL